MTKTQGVAQCYYYSICGTSRLKYRKRASNLYFLLLKRYISLNIFVLSVQMSSSNSDYETCNSECNSDESIADLELEDGVVDTDDVSNHTDDFVCTCPYSDEPMADDSWIEAYNEEMRLAEERQIELEGRLNGVSPVSEW